MDGSNSTPTDVANDQAIVNEQLSMLGFRLSDAHRHMLLTQSKIHPVVVDARGYVTVTTVEQLRRKFADHITFTSEGENYPGDPRDQTIHLGYVTDEDGGWLRHGHFWPGQLRLPTLLIPMWWGGRTQVGHRHRPDEPRTDEDGKIVKYEQPAKLAIHLDVNPYAWEWVTNPAYELAITEGEKKADALVSVGVPAITLTGVWCWQREGKPLPEWDDVPLQGRTVHLVFDNDVATKEPVQEALTKLTTFLRGRGANVLWTIPPEGPAKGVDDYLAAGGTWEQLKESSVEPPEEASDGEVEPWPEPVDGQALLSELVDFFSGPLVLPEGGAEACALYAVMTYAVDMLELVPYLSASSAVMRSGKTRLTTLFSFVVRKPLVTTNASPSAIFRECERSQPTLILDEGDTFITMNEELRGILNSGYDRNLKVLRAVPVGRDFVARPFSAFGPKIIALIGDLPATVMDRTIFLEMRRKRRTDQVVAFRRRQRGIYRSQGRQLARKIVRWVEDHRRVLVDAEPVMPVELDDRAADNWEPLLTIADEVGGDWPDRARKVAVLLSAERDERTVDEKIQLLADIYAIFKQNGGYPIQPTGLALALCAMDERPWRSHGARNECISSDRIGKILGTFGIKSKKSRVTNPEILRHLPSNISQPVRLYWPDLFKEAWERYEIREDNEQEWTWR
jgi:putative DNA primase/helicase